MEMNRLRQVINNTLWNESVYHDNQERRETLVESLAQAIESVMEVSPEVREIKTSYFDDIKFSDAVEVASVHLQHMRPSIEYGTEAHFLTIARTPCKRLYVPNLLPDTHRFTFREYTLRLTENSDITLYCVSCGLSVKGVGQWVPKYIALAQHDSFTVPEETPNDSEPKKHGPEFL